LQTPTAAAWSIIPAIWNGRSGRADLAGPQWRNAALLAQGIVFAAHAMSPVPASGGWTMLGITTEITDWRALRLCNGLPWMIGNASVSRSPRPASTAGRPARIPLSLQESCQDRPHSWIR